MPVAATETATRAMLSTSRILVRRDITRKLVFLAAADSSLERGVCIQPVKLKNFSSLSGRNFTKSPTSTMDSALSSRSVMMLDII